MSELPPCPKAAALGGLVDPRDYAAFGAGWCDGIARCTASPAPIEVVEDLALLLESAALVERISPPV
ncbi:hypothetical protein EDF62_1995 [Leucobacter luti]|uniref:Uncharacterized protein n=1 Tax=Leucobacter luti TaxID=340320 RepID=A0A4R6RWI3_9MICO|nr:hypothetical protein EDF62_1995 [Leucobacter luti]